MSNSYSVLCAGSRRTRSIFRGPSFYPSEEPNNDFMGPMRRLFKKVNEQRFDGKMKLSRAACQAMNDMVVDGLHTLLLETEILMKHGNRTFLTCRSLDKAVRIWIHPQRLAKRTRLSARKAVCASMRAV